MTMLDQRRWRSGKLGPAVVLRRDRPLGRLADAGGYGRLSDIAFAKRCEQFWPAACQSTAFARVERAATAADPRLARVADSDAVSGHHSPSDKKRAFVRGEDQSNFL